MTDMGEKHHWNHRVVRRRTTGPAEVSYAIHECHYTDGKLEMLTVDATPAYGEDLEGLRWSLTKMLEALDKPVVDYETRKEIEKV